MSVIPQENVKNHNIAAGPLEGEWGLSIWIGADDTRILLDTGASGLFARNAERLGLDLGGVDVGVLSHAHYDHADGMDAFFALNRTAPFLVREGTRENCFGVRDGKPRYIGIRGGILEEYAARIRYVRGVCEIAGGIWLIPHRRADYSVIALRDDLYAVNGGERRPDDFSHEQSLVFETRRGLVAFNSCSHTGVTNVLADIRQALGRDDVRAYVGGLHLYHMTDEELDALCGEIERTPIERVLTGHCTGDHAFAFLSKRLGGRVAQFYSGFTCRF